MQFFHANNLNSSEKRRTFDVLAQQFRERHRPIGKPQVTHVGETSEPPVARIPWRNRRSAQVRLRSTRSHVHDHYRRNYHVASTPGAFQLRGIGEARQGEARRGARAPSFSPREKPVRGRVCYLSPWIPPPAKERGPRESAYRFICILVCRCKSFNYVHHKSRHGPSVCSCARAHVCSPPSPAPPSLPVPPPCTPSGVSFATKSGIC